MLLKSSSLSPHLASEGLCLPQRRLDFLSRVAEPSAIREAVLRFDACISTTLRKLLALPADLPDLETAQIYYSPAHGGYGLVALEPRLHANFVDGALSAAPHIAAATGAGPLLDVQEITAHELALEASVAHVAATAGCEPPSWLARAAGNVAHRRWGAKAMRMIREDRRQREQLQRRQLGAGQAARQSRGICTEAAFKGPLTWGPARQGG